MSKLKPIVFINGDQTAGQVALMVRGIIFGDIPMIERPCTIEDRLRTKDKFIDECVLALKNLGAGVKISTATDDDRIRAAGLGSANIKMREDMRVYGIFRHIEKPKGFKKPVAVFRYGSGGIYNEISSSVYVADDGDEYDRTITNRNVTNIKFFAEKAILLAEKHGLRLRVSSKWTISKSEKRFMNIITKVFDEKGVEYETDLTDVGFAKISTDEEGGWLWLFDNANGDSASDVVDWRDSTRSMTSTVYCRDEIVYEEMPGGTAPDKFETDLIGEDFFNPLGIIGCFARAIVRVNPDQKFQMARIDSSANHYLTSFREGAHSTGEMIYHIANNMSND